MIRKYIIVEDSSKGFDKGIAMLEKVWGAEEIEPCNDCISREEAIRIAEQGQIQGYEWQFKKLCTLPSVTPQPKTGHWIDVESLDSALWHECSECGETEFYATDYCPNCGAKMVEPQESEDKG